MLPRLPRPFARRDKTMNRLCQTLTYALGALALASTLAACDKEDPAQREACEAFAKHLAGVVADDQGGSVPQEQVDKMIASTTDKCVEAPPGKAEMDCAMAATDLDAMKACDPNFEPAEDAAPAEDAN